MLDETRAFQEMLSSFKRGDNFKVREFFSPRPRKSSSSCYQISSLLCAASANSLFISAAIKNVHLTLNFGTPPAADAADLVVQNLRMLRHRAFPHERRHACTRFCLCKFHRLVCACVLCLVDATDATKVAIFFVTPSESRRRSQVEACMPFNSFLLVLARIDF